MAIKETDILIFGGQSNMQGQTEVLSEIVENAYEYRFLTDTFCMNPHVGGRYSALGLERLGTAAGKSMG